LPAGIELDIGFSRLLACCDMAHSDADGPPEEVSNVPAETPLVLREVSNGVATLTLNRPDRLNAWTPDLQAQLYGSLAEMKSDPDVRVVVITGAGRGFCVGADTEVLQV